MYLLHTSHRRNRLAIRRHGLIPRRPADHNWKNSDSYVLKQPIGVYGKTLGMDPWRPGEMIDSEEHYLWDVYAFEVTDDGVHDDPLVTGARYVTFRVPFDSVRRIVTVEESWQISSDELEERVYTAFGRGQSEEVSRERDPLVPWCRETIEPAGTFLQWTRPAQS